MLHEIENCYQWRKVTQNAFVKCNILLIADIAFRVGKSPIAHN